MPSRSPDGCCRRPKPHRQRFRPEPAPGDVAADGRLPHSRLRCPTVPCMVDQTRSPRPPLRFGVAHDFRCPPGSTYRLEDVYAQTIEQLRVLDALGIDLVWFSEHHFVEDGYLPSFVPVAGAAAAATERMRISTDIALAPFYHPIRLAEDVAVLDQLSAGRMELGIG